MASAPKQNATLRQVAEHAGVSVTTASLVLNRKGEISEKYAYARFASYGRIELYARGERVLQIRLHLMP